MTEKEGLALLVLVLFFGFVVSKLGHGPTTEPVTSCPPTPSVLTAENRKLREVIGLQQRQRENLERALKEARAK